jgi:general secretion pathway protein J
MRHSRGFTLLEMLLAIVLLLVLAGLAYGTLRIGMRGWEAADAHADQGDALRVAWPFLHTTLENAHPFAGHNLNLQSFAGSGREIRWISALPAHFAAAGLRLLVLRIEQDPDHQREQLVLRNFSIDVASEDSDIAADTTAAADQQRAVLVDDLAGLSIAYYGIAEGARTPSWQDSWAQRNTLPQLIRIDIEPSDAAPWPSLYAHPYLAGELPDSEQLHDEGLDNE